MMASSQLPQRRSIRLPAFDYAAAGAYFVTLVTHRRQCMLGSLEGESLAVSDAGKVVEEEWTATRRIRREVGLGPYVVMPNHLHALIVIETNELAIGCAELPATSACSRPPGPTRRSLASLIAGFKSATTRRCREQKLIADNTSLWQRNYFEHVVRNEDDWHAIEDYIADNPRRWLEDRENPETVEPRLKWNCTEPQPESGRPPVAPTNNSYRRT